MTKSESLTQYRVELRKTILKTSLAAFHKKGIKAVKMDDIATELSISKRTLYELFSNKEELLFECVKESDDELDQHMHAIFTQQDNTVMDVIFAFYQVNVQAISEVEPIFFEELHKYSRIMDYIQTRRDSRESETISFFRRGVDEGYFRNDVDYSFVVNISKVVIDHVMQQKMYEKYPMQHILRNFFILQIRGFCTQKGIAILDYMLNIK